MAEKENKEIKKAIDIIDEMSMDEKEWELYESRRLAIMDYNTNMKLFREEGLELGIKQGIKQGNWYNIPIDVDTIKEGYPKLCA